MSEDKKREPAVMTNELWKKLIARGVPVPANVARIIVDCRAGQPVLAHWSCFADEDLVDVVVDAICDILREEKS